MRGRQYGRAAAGRIRRSIEIYTEVFEHYASWEWDRARAFAARYLEPIRAYRPHLVVEMEGISAGAGVPFEDILTLNARTEIINAAVARAAGAAFAPPAECTCALSLPGRSAARHTVIGQNWDWKPATAETVVVLEAECDDGPNFVTVVEAGLLAKTGMNAAGLGLTTNALVTDRDDGRPGVPYHVVLRAILEAERLSAALYAITYPPRASSANYMIAHRDGEAADVEAAPGDYADLQIRFPETDTLLHTNHFLDPVPGHKDVGIWEGPGSLVRYQRMKRAVENGGGAFGIESFQEALRDHFNHPHSVCAHPDPSVPPPGQYATVASVIMDLTERRMWLVEGNPCEGEYLEMDYSGLLT